MRNITYCNSYCCVFWLGISLICIFAEFGKCVAYRVHWYIGYVFLLGSQYYVCLLNLVYVCVYGELNYAISGLDDKICDELDDMCVLDL